MVGKVIPGPCVISVAFLKVCDEVGALRGLPKDLCGKCVFEMLDHGIPISVNGDADDVETAKQIMSPGGQVRWKWSAHEKLPCHSNELLLFPVIDRIEGMPEISSMFGSDLDENDLVLFANDKIEFPRPGSKISGDYRISQVREVPKGEFFTPRSKSVARVGTHVAVLPSRR